MPLAHVDGAVPRLSQQAGKGHVGGVETAPVPVGRTERSGIVLSPVDPVRGAVPRRVLACHERDAGRRADAHRVERAEAHAGGRQPLHRRRVVEVVERMAMWSAIRVSEERDRRVHHAQVVHEEDDDVGSVGRDRVSGGGGEQRGPDAHDAGHDRRLHTSHTIAACRRASTGSSQVGMNSCATKSS